MVTTGVRAAESARRAGYAVVTVCNKPGKEKTMVAPILHWSDDDVWTYIRRRELPYCNLYDEGWKRLGCVFCPFERKIAKSKAKWPRMFAGLQKCCDAAYEAKESWHQYGSAEAVLEWWLDRDLPPPHDDAQECFAFDQFEGGDVING